MLSDSTIARERQVMAAVDHAEGMDQTSAVAYLEERFFGNVSLKEQAIRQLHCRWELAQALADSEIGNELIPGAIFGDIRVLKKLGHGGMGVVYLGEELEPARTVAVKMITPSLVGSWGQPRFQREYQALARMNHENIAHFYRLGQHEGIPYVVMEYVEGQPITEFCRERNLDVGSRLALFLRVCDGVAHAHQNLIIHRDIKPDNVLVQVSDSHVKLVDFGIAKFLDREEPDSVMSEHQRPQRLTHTGQFVGTPAYASPEALNREPLNVRADIFSLGLLLYELLVGVNPRTARMDTTDDAKPTNPAAGFPKPSELRPFPERRQLFQRREPHIPVELDAIATKATREKPDDRYQEVRELREDIARFLREEPVFAHSNTWTYVARKFVRRCRWRVFVAAAMLLLAVAIPTVRYFAVTKEQKQTRLERDRAEATVDFLIDLFEVSDPERGELPNLTALDIVERGASDIERRFQAQPEVKEILQETIGLVFLRMGVHERALSLFLKTLSSRRARLGKEHAFAGTSLDNLGLAYHEMGRFEEAEKCYREALEIKQAHWGLDAPQVGTNMSNLAGLMRELGRTEEAEALYWKALQIFECHPKKNEDDIANCHNSLAILYGSEPGGLPLARRHLQKAITIRERLYKANPKLALTYHTLAALHYLSGHLEEAVTSEQKAVEMFRKFHRGKETPGFATALDNLGIYLMRAGRYQEAESVITEGLNLRKEIWNSVHPDQLLSLNKLALSHRFNAEYEKGLEVLEEARIIVDELTGGDWRHLQGEPRVFWGCCLNTKGLLEHDLGQLDLAGESLQKCLKFFAPGFKQKPTSTWKFDAALAKYYLENDRIEEAERIYDSLLESRLEVFERQHVDVAFSIWGLGQVAFKRRQLLQAELLISEALMMARAKLPSRHYKIARMVEHLALVSLARGDLQQAENRAREALDLFSATFGTDHPWTGDALMMLAQIELAQDRFDEAAVSAHCALDIFNLRLPERHWKQGKAKGLWEAATSNMGRYAEVEPNKRPKSNILHYEVR
ncbi:Non-specific serine/threonine protein kinase [Sulfidibacter corallicola]|uniref:Serine/threonine protein kinase n=1 Tax=Sulfidibacter corallicola TaxID=2818388 RepID=A0A8A4TL59_SULCO|nr:tetratricopeptide repeat protein [Sulfidibacter corallicola]QTD50696.1 serine/threonine protein kinase [Sulfidibacter corallicola]